MGEVRTPGTYPLTRDTTGRSVGRAGSQRDAPRGIDRPTATAAKTGPILTEPEHAESFR